MAEAAAAGLTPAMGRAQAHHALQRAADRALGEGRTLSDVLRDDPEVRRHLSAEQIERLIDPAGYLGSAGIFVDRVVDRITRLS